MMSKSTTASRVHACLCVCTKTLNEFIFRISLHRIEWISFLSRLTEGVMSRIKQPKTFEEATGVSSIQCLFCFTFFCSRCKVKWTLIFTYIRGSQDSKKFNRPFQFLYLNWRSTHRMLNSRENYANVDEQRAKNETWKESLNQFTSNGMLIITIIMESWEKEPFCFWLCTLSIAKLWR